MFRCAPWNRIGLGPAHGCVAKWARPMSDNTNLFHRAMAVFDSVCRLPAAERKHVLDRSCADDSSLRAEVESLLAEHDRQGLLDEPHLRSGLPGIFPETIGLMLGVNGDRAEKRGGSLTFSEPQRIGHYRILRVIGEGGMGIVYEAEQESPRRIVALKVVRGGYMNKEMLRRF